MANRRPIRPVRPGRSQDETSDTERATDAMPDNPFSDGTQTGGQFTAPAPPDVPARGSEGPRESHPEPGPNFGGAATPRRPSAPTPMAGSMSGGTDAAQLGTGGVIPFAPLGSVEPSSPTSRLRALFGHQGGLTGGGFGLPFGTSNAQNQSISGLLQQLLGQGKKGLF